MPVLSNHHRNEIELRVIFSEARDGGLVCCNLTESWSEGQLSGIVLLMERNCCCLLIPVILSAGESDQAGKCHWLCAVLHDSVNSIQLSCPCCINTKIQYRKVMRLFKLLPEKTSPLLESRCLENTIRPLSRCTSPDCCVLKRYMSKVTISLETCNPDIL